MDFEHQQVDQASRAHAEGGASGRGRVGWLGMVLTIAAPLAFWAFAAWAFITLL